MGERIAAGGRLLCRRACPRRRTPYAAPLAGTRRYSRDLALVSPTGQGCDLSTSWYPTSRTPKLCGSMAFLPGRGPYKLLGLPPAICARTYCWFFFSRALENAVLIIGFAITSHRRSDRNRRQSAGRWGSFFGEFHIQGPNSTPEYSIERSSASV